MTADIPPPDPRLSGKVQIKQMQEPQSQQRIFSAAELQNYLGPNYLGGAYGNLTNAPTFASDGTPLVNGQIPTQYLDSGAMALINHVLPLPNKPTGSDGYNYSKQNLVNNNIFQTTGGVKVIPPSVFCHLIPCSVRGPIAGMTPSRATSPR